MSYVWEQAYGPWKFPHLETSLAVASTCMCIAPSLCSADSQSSTSSSGSAKTSTSGASGSTQTSSGSTQTSPGSTQTSSGSTQAMIVTHTPSPVPLDVGGSVLSEGMNGDPHLPTSGYFVEGSMGLAGMRLFEWTADADLRFRRGIARSAAVAVQDVAVTSVTKAAPATSQRRTGYQLQVGYRIAVASSAVAETVGPSIAAAVSDQSFITRLQSEGLVSITAVEVTAAPQVRFVKQPVGPDSALTVRIVLAVVGGLVGAALITGAVVWWWCRKRARGRRPTPIDVAANLFDPAMRHRPLSPDLCSPRVSSPPVSPDVRDNVLLVAQNPQQDRVRDVPCLPVPSLPGACGEDLDAPPAGPHA